MNELITLSLLRKDVTKLLVFPRELLTMHEKELIDWIVGYERRYDEVPSVSRTKREFPSFIEVAGDESAILDDIYDMTVAQLRREYVTSRLGALSVRLETDASVDMRDELRHLLSVATDVDRIFARYSTFDRELYFRSGGIDVGLRLLDRAMGGICNGDFMLLVGRLGTGKSTLAEWFTMNWWRAGKTILYVSKEMLASDVFGRIDAFVGRFNPLLIRTDRGIKPKLDVIKHLASEMEGDIIVPSRSLSSPDQIREVAMQIDIDAVVVDGVHLMMPSGSKRFSARWERVAEVSNELKQLALTLHKPIVGVSQLKRTGEKMRYDPEDIAYSDALGQDADFIAALRPMDVEHGRIEVQLIKNRFGPEMATVIRVDFDTMTIIEESVDGRTDDDWS